MSIIDTAKDHPYITGSVLVAGVVLLVLIMSSGGGSAQEEQGTAIMGPVDTGQAMYAADRQAATDALNITSQLEAIKVKGANDLAVATLQSQSYDHAQTLQADVQKTAINAQLTSDTLSSTLLAQLEGNKVAAEKEIALASTNAVTERERLRVQENKATQDYLYNSQWLTTQANLQALTITHGNETTRAAYMYQTVQALANGRVSLPSAG